MTIHIKGAREQNLKNLNLDIPNGAMIGIAGVSGSGKSTLARDVITQYAYQRYGNWLSKSSRDLLHNDRMIDVDSIEGLMPTIFIDVVNSINNARSTLATITGMQSILRSLFNNYGVYRCQHCGSTVENNIWNIIEKKNYDIELFASLKCDSKLKLHKEALVQHSSIIKEVYYDSNDVITTVKSKQAYVHIYIDSSKLTKELVDSLYKKYTISLKIRIKDLQIDELDLLTETYCVNCNKVLKTITTKRFTFNIDYDNFGGACRVCKGYGIVNLISPEDIILDKNAPILKGAIKFVTEKGIQYAKVSDKFLEAVAKQHGFRLSTPLCELTSHQFDVLFYGNHQIVKFQDRQGANGGKKKAIFIGIIPYLVNCFSEGKGKDVLEPYVKSNICEHCKGTRLDKDFSFIYLEQYNYYDFLNMKIEDLLIKLKDLTSFATKHMFFAELEILIEKLQIFMDLDCGYLSLSRASNTLSGGELQRIRLAKFINIRLSNICLVLDEPSTGLHPVNIKNLLQILDKIKINNTIIIIEHNVLILQHCDFIVDLGRTGGHKGGELLFADKTENILKHDTVTVKSLTEQQSKSTIAKKQIDSFEPLEWHNILELKKGSCNIALNALVCLCGVSGSGKSTFAKEVIIPHFNKYSDYKILFMGQNNHIKMETSNVGSMLGLNIMIAKLYEAESQTMKHSCFLLNSEQGKCQFCHGKGKTTFSTEEIAEECPHCNGQKFNDEVLKIKYNGLSIIDFLNLTITELYDFIPDSKIKKVLYESIEAGIGYLSLSRSSKTLSKGEIQRIKLVSTISDRTKKSIIILDEPSRGLHNHDITKLLSVLRKIIDQGNTIIAIEHNISFIECSDWIIEFGPEAGSKGGTIVYCGEFYDFILANTNTSQAIDRKKRINEINTCHQYDEVSLAKTHINNQNTISNLQNDNQVVKSYMNIVDYTNKLYLNSILPVKYVSSLDIHNDENIQHSFLPLNVKVDIHDTKYPLHLTILEALNIKNDIAVMFCKASNIEKYLARRVFYFTDKLGKCGACGGKGITIDIDDNVVFNGENISTEIMEILESQTNFKIAKTALKKLYKHDISQPYSKMSDNEQILFLYGDSSMPFLYKNKEYKWDGMYKAIDNIYGERKNKKQCRLCKGQLLDSGYANILHNDLTYGCLLTSKIQDLLRIDIKDLPSKIFFAIKWLNLLGFQQNSLCENITNFTTKQKALLKLLSIYTSGIKGINVILFDYNELRADNVSIDELVNHISLNNFITTIS